MRKASFDQVAEEDLTQVVACKLKHEAGERFGETAFQEAS